MCKAPFVKTDCSGKSSGIDTTRILEKIIAGALTAAVIGFGSWFMFVNKMQMNQEIIKKEVSMHIEATDKRHIEFVRHNNEAHQSIIDDQKIMFQHLMDEMKEVTHELRSMRQDFYVPFRGQKNDAG